VNVLTEIRQYKRSHYGNLISVEEPEFDKAEKIWKVKLKSDYPRIIQDDISPEKRMIKFITLKGLGEIRLSEKLEVIEATPRKKCVENLSSFLKIWLKRAESIIVSASAKQLARVSGADWLLNPINMIVTNLLQKEVIQDWEIEKDWRPKKVRQYLMLLEELGLVVKTEDGWTYGNLFTALREESSNNVNFATNILSYVIKERYSTLREVFNISRFETFVHIDTCYYAPSIEAEKLLFREEKTIYGDYLHLYSKISPLRVRQILGELVSVGALQQKDSYCYGNAELFSEMVEKKSQLEVIAPPSAGLLPLA